MKRYSVSQVVTEMQAKINSFVATIMAKLKIDKSRITAITEKKISHTLFIS